MEHSGMDPYTSIGTKPAGKTDFVKAIGCWVGGVLTTSDNAYVSKLFL